MLKEGLKGIRTSILMQLVQDSSNLRAKVHNDLLENHRKRFHGKVAVRGSKDMYYLSCFRDGAPLICGRHETGKAISQRQTLQLG